MTRAKQLFIAWVFLISPVFSQKKPVILLNDKDGLSDNVVRVLRFDHEGVLWIGTERGLARYDGNRFENYHKYDGLAGEKVWALAVDDSNRVYAGCRSNGISVLEKGKVVKTWMIPDNETNSIRNLLWDPESRCLVVGTEYGPYLLRDTVFYKIRFPYISGKRSPVVSLKRYKGHIYFTVVKFSPGLYELRINKDSPERSEAVPIIVNRDMDAITFSGDKIYAAGDTSLFACSMTTGRQEILLTDPHISGWRDLLMLPDGKILAGSYYSRYYHSALYDIQKNEITELPWLVPHEHIFTFNFDTVRRIIWAGTSNGIMAFMNTPFSYFEEEIENIIDKVYWEGDLYILKHDGVYIFKDQKIRRILTGKEIRGKIREDMIRYFSRYGVRYDTILSRPLQFRSFIRDKGKIYLNTSMGSVQLPHLNAYLPYCCGRFLSQGRGVYHFRDYKNIYYYPDGNIQNRKKFFKRDTLILNITMAEGKEGIIFMPTYFHGVFAVKNGRLFQLNENNSKIDGYLRDADIDSEGDLWVISIDGNLFRITFRDSLVLLETINRFNSPVVGEDYKWLKFHNGFLYLATNKGLNILSEKDVRSGKIRDIWFYNRSNGYFEYSTYDPVSVGGAYLVVNAKKHLERIGKPFGKRKGERLMIRDMEIDGVELDAERLEGKSFPHSTRNIQMNFFLLKYPTDKNVIYRYRINDGSWTFSNNVNLPYLKPGGYRIVLEARDLERNDLYRKEIAFFISRPFWVRWWFIMLSLFILLGGISFYFKKRYERMRREEEEKNRMKIESAGLRIQALQMQMNPHFIFNALNTIQSAVLLKNKDEVLDFIADLSLVIRENLENVTKDHIPLAREIAFLHKYIAIEQFRFGKKLEIDFIVSVPDPDNLLIPPMLIEPLLENSINHGIQPKKTGGEIELKIDEEMGYLLITVRDNGIGRKKAAELTRKNPRQSKGVLLLRTRLNYLNQKYNTSVYRIEFEDLYENGEPAGTVARLYLQIIRRKKEEAQN